MVADFATLFINREHGSWIAGGSSSSRGRGFARGSGGFGASQNGAHAGRQFARAERFHEVIIRAHFQTGDPVDFVFASGHKDDRHRGVRAEFAAELEAGRIRQTDIQDDECKLTGGEFDQRVLPRGAPDRLESLGLQRVDDVVGDRGLIFDQENLACHVGGTPQPMQTVSKREANASAGTFRADPGVHFRRLHAVRKASIRTPTI